MTSLEFWSGVIAVVVVQISGIFIALRQIKSQKPLTEAQSQSALGDAWEKLGQEYQRLLGNNKAQEDELVSLRPLTLKIALQEMTIKQTEEDKADWKHYAEKLVKQIEDSGEVPIAFRRTPTSDGDTLEKIKTITRQEIKERGKK